MDGRLHTDDFVDLVVTFENVVDAYMRMNSNPEMGIMLGVDHFL